MHENELSRWLESKIIGTYLIRENDTIDVDGDVNLEGKLGDLGELGDYGICFGKVTGNFNCQKNRLISLKGTPEIVGGDFFCGANHLPSLSGAPNEVGGKFDCSENPLNSLDGFPERILGGFFCKTCNLDSFLGTSLPEHFQKYVSPEWWAQHLEKKAQFEEKVRKATSTLTEQPHGGGVISMGDDTELGI